MRRSIKIRSVTSSAREVVVHGPRDRAYVLVGDNNGTVLHFSGLAALTKLRDTLTELLEGEADR